MEPHSQDFEPEEPQPPKIDADGNVCLDRIFNEDGKPKQEYPLPPHKADRRNDFENALMNAYMTKKAAEDGTEPPPRKYQSEFDRKFHEWQQRRWQNYMQTREWAETGAPRALWLFDKTHGVMFGVGEFFADAFGISGSRYQWVINAAERQAFEERRAQEDDDEEMRAMQEEEDRRLDAEANALEDGTNLETSATEEDGGAAEATEAAEAATGTADGGGAVATEEPPATEPINA